MGASLDKYIKETEEKYIEKTGKEEKGSSKERLAAKESEIQNMKATQNYPKDGESNKSLDQSEIIKNNEKLNALAASLQHANAFFNGVNVSDDWGKLKEALYLCHAGYKNPKYVDFIIDTLSKEKNIPKDTFKDMPKEFKDENGELLLGELVKKRVVARLLERHNDDVRKTFLDNILEKHDGKYTNLLAIQLNKQRHGFRTAKIFGKERLNKKETRSISTLEKEVKKLSGAETVLYLKKK